MATYLSDLAQKGTVLRLRNQEAFGEVQGEIEFPVGTVLAATDVVDLVDFAPNTYPTYWRFHMPGMDGGADGGFESTLGYVSEGTLLSPTTDVDAWAVGVDDGAGTFIEADLTGTNGTAFPGAGPLGGKAIYDNDIVHARLTVDNAAPAAAVTEGRNIVRFVIRYARLDLSGAVLPYDYTPAPIVLPTEPPNQVQNFDGLAANS